jgi:hypothetical protein
MECKASLLMQLLSLSWSIRHLFGLAMHLEIKSIMQTNTIEVRTVSLVRATGPYVFSSQSLSLDKTAKSDDGASEDKLVIDLCPDTLLDSRWSGRVHIVTSVGHD